MIPNQLELYTFRRYKQVLHMSDREIIVPPTLQSIMDRAGYAPAVRVGDTLYCAGQVGRTRDMEVILNPEAQFIACWENLRTVLAEGGCTFDDIVDMTTYHVAMSEHMPVFRDVKNRIFPRGQCAWTCIGVAELAHPGLLLEIKCIAVRRNA
ncbi:Endoribonuclease L-PSP protein [Pseudomonas syringae pv. antirrhini]|uniref:Endoribonuclease L-PSP family protein n=1 Tax=Pseudomonas syringae pv. antirrhini TaxID=251702 RepID=A0A0P9JQ61_9PSED|nr:Endoribonuclease L-PSP family protein [Pseudomonas syringae pv. antirrhini]RMP38900.1 Endoribonuclease L-PSP protein [Pseudomonas syringae pv. antirrhini]RMP41302.1 Endoribonuclease L-PSP protein [Pseudomonas syringae pv. antirrhini]RMW24038.1 Endoribonuclease L-PSP protein [Pseudomonas syringae pv. antirrhini]